MILGYRDEIGLCEGSMGLWVIALKGNRTIYRAIGYRSIGGGL